MYKRVVLNLPAYPWRQNLLVRGAACAAQTSPRQGEHLVAAASNTKDLLVDRCRGVARGDNRL
jgi:hypothetical protein